MYFHRYESDQTVERDQKRLIHKIIFVIRPPSKVFFFLLKKKKFLKKSKKSKLESHRRLLQP